MDDNGLVINPEKTHLMVFGSRRSATIRQEVSIVAGGHLIRPSETTKLLGGQLHQSLKWNYHISDSKASLLKQLTSRINGLVRVCRNSKFCTRLMLANGAVHSKLVYLITVWGGAQWCLLRAVQIQQLRAARAVCGFQSTRWSKVKLLGKVGWLSVRQLIEYYTVLQVHKTLTTGKPRPLYYSLSESYPYFTRGAASGHIRLPLNTSLKSFRYRAMVSYNRVPQILLQGSMTTVKKTLKQRIRKNIPLDF